MVCLGNICRSPLAQGVLEEICTVKNLDWEIDSAGTASWHVGNPPDMRSIKVAQKYGIDIRKQRARQFDQADFRNFDLILAMDQENYNNIMDLALAEEDRKKVHLILNFAYPQQNRAVPDPYYDNSFEQVYNLLKNACQKMVQLYR